MSSSITETYRALAKTSLGMFAQVYDDTVKEHGAPKTGQEFLDMMNKAIFVDELVQEAPLKRSESPAVVVPTVTTPEVNVTTEQALEQHVSSIKVSAKDINKAVKDFQYLAPGETRKNKIDLPFLPNCIDYNNSCPALILNGGLFSPCMTRLSGQETFCKACNKKGNPVHLNKRDQEGCRYVCEETGKTSITWGTYLAKRNIPREFVDQFVKANNLTIPETEWVVDSKKVIPRRKRSPSTSSDEASETGSVATNETSGTKKRGRPKKVYTPEELEAKAAKEAQLLAEKEAKKAEREAKKAAKVK